uniref:Uncharacterized protein n=1 Tax=Rhizophora mucronata TaxID=61149 RepID=A0A2P2P1M6_RHIMU
MKLGLFHRSTIKMLSSFWGCVWRLGCPCWFMNMFQMGLFTSIFITRGHRF